VTTGSVAVGLGATAIAADGGLIVDTGEIITTGGDFLGFRTLDADPDGFDFGYKVGATAGLTVTKDVAKVVTADTFVKLGFLYEANSTDATKRISYYVDGVKGGTYVTDTAMAAATFPNSVMMGVMIAAKSDGGSVARMVDVDWVKYCQYVS
jgi:hypothetical protein